MRKPQKLNLIVRVKTKSDVFPALEAANILTDYANFLRQAALGGTDALSPQGAHLHREGAIEWNLEINDGEHSSETPEEGLDEGLRSPE